MVYTVLNKQDFEQELEDAGDRLVVIDFFANWCGPCKFIEPQLQELSLKYADRAKFLKVNVDDCEDIVAAYNITSMPTFVFMKDQQIIDILVGGNAEKLVKNIEKYVEDKQKSVGKLKATGRKDEEDGLRDVEYALENDLDENNELPDDPTAVLEVIVDDQ